jgi:eukaryotic-like serine/threonine-protein kinase
MPNANRCPNCGAELPPGAPVRSCPRCSTQPAFVEPTAPPPEARIAGSQAIDVRSLGPTDATRTTDGQAESRDLPRGTIIGYFGDYEIHNELGRGGMGVVYSARQLSLNRPVALKMIKAGILADHAELQRFQNEAEAVALLDHAGIVPVYEVGEHDGQRYFSMKLVEGGNLAEQLESFKHNPRGAATLLALTAEAVHHAHMRGILHRDLKPANVLVDALGHPHVTDFGLAKRVESDVEMTQSGAILGTPAYMSPEQANGRRGTITTATDVYGLGAILYALLTGKAPFGGDSVLATLDAVRARPPEPPTRLNAKVPRDLETICLKCLEKEPRRRYTSAHELSSDLNNWLLSRPISARRVGTAERAWLWCKRKPAVAALAAAVILAVVAGTSAVIVVQAKANAKLQTANFALDDQRARAENRETQAIEAVKSFRDAVANEPTLKNNPTLRDLRKRLLKEPLAFFKALRDRLQADEDTRPESLVRLAQATFALGKLTNEIGDKQDALVAYRESRAIFQKLADGSPQDTALQGELATNLDNLGALLGDTGNTPEAMSAIESSLAIRQKLVNGDRSAIDFQRQLAATHNALGNLLNQNGKPVEALKAYESSRAVIQKLADANPTVIEIQRLLATSHNNIGLILRGAGKLAEALEANESSLAIRQKLADENRTVTDLQSDLAASHNNIALVLRANGKRAQALKSFESALTITRKLADENPAVTDFQSSLGDAYNNLASLLWATEKIPEALLAYHSALPIYRALADANPTNLAFANRLGGCQYNIGILLKETGKPAEALKAYDRALTIHERTAREHPELPKFASNVGAILNNAAMIDLDAKRFEEARVRLKQAVSWQRKALASSPATTLFRQYLDNHLNNLIEADQGLGDMQGLAETKRELADFRDSNPTKVDLDARLAVILKGDQQPRDEAERLRLAQRAYEKSLPAAAARLWAEALATNPKLGDDRDAELRLRAARAATLAASGQGKENPPPDEAAKAKLRAQARGWLKADLAATAKVFDAGLPELKTKITHALKHWKIDVELAGVRDDESLARMPEPERAAFKQLWQDVDQILSKAPRIK